MINEVWEDIKDVEGLYRISNLGRVLSIRRNSILKPLSSHHGYMRIQLYKNGKMKVFAIHRLVATAFIPNPHNYNEVNHLNENASDNRAVNLEWCSRKHNVNYGNRLYKFKKKVEQLDKNNNVIKTYNSLSEASKESGARQGAISNVCCGRAKTAGGYKWMFKAGG